MNNNIDGCSSLIILELSFKITIKYRDRKNVFLSWMQLDSLNAPVQTTEKKELHSYSNIFRQFEDTE